MVCSSGRYQSILNGGNGGEKVDSNGVVNQQNQIQNVMFIQQDNNEGNYNVCPPYDQLVPGKDGSIWSL